MLVKEAGLSETDARRLLSSVGLTKTATDAKACGIIHDVQDVHIPSGAPIYQLTLKH